MTPRCYMDFNLAGNGLPAPLLAGAALKALHGGFCAQPGRYALALPRYPDAPFAALRVFAAERGHLDELVQAVENHPAIRDYVLLGYSRLVPEGFSGGWSEFRRYRIPARRAGRKPGDDLRERRMRQADAAKLPFFILQSRGNGQQFGLYLDIRSPAEPAQDCRPDGYGLSVASRPFALPDLP